MDVDHWDETSQQSLFWSHVAIINQSQLIDFTLMMGGGAKMCCASQYFDYVYTLSMGTRYTSDMQVIVIFLLFMSNIS